MTEDQLEQEALSWLAELGYAVHAGPYIAHNGPNPQRADYRQVILPFRLREAIQRLNPGIPTAARAYGRRLRDWPRCRWRWGALCCCGVEWRFPTAAFRCRSGRDRPSFMV